MLLLVFTSVEWIEPGDRESTTDHDYVENVNYQVCVLMDSSMAISSLQQVIELVFHLC